MILLGAVCLPLVAQDFGVNRIQIDRKKWGFRNIEMIIINGGSDTANVAVTIKTTTPGNYLSGEEVIITDSTFDVYPGTDAAYKFPMEWPGAYGRISSLVNVEWQIRRQQGENIDSGYTSQVIEASINPGVDIYGYRDTKFSLGPMAAVGEYQFINYEYPRIMLYLLARDKSVYDLQSLFTVEVEYNKELIRRFAAIGLFPYATDSDQPAMVGISEKDAYALVEIIKSAGEDFRAWIDNDGREFMSNVYSAVKADADSGGRELLYLLTILTAWSNHFINDYYHPAEFNVAAMDQYRLTTPRWLVQGGDFFMPKLSLVPFFDVEYLNIAPIVRLSGEKHESKLLQEAAWAFDNEESTVLQVDASVVRKAVEMLNNNKEFSKVSDKVFKKVDLAFETIEAIKASQKPYLAEYFFRKLLGDYFSSLVVTRNGLLQIRYES